MTVKNPDKEYERNVLTDPQKVELYNAVKGMQPEIDQDKVTIAEAAARLSKRLGFTVTQGNLRSPAKAYGITFFSQLDPKHHPVNQAVSKATEALAQLKTLTDDLNAVRVDVRRVAADLGGHDRRYFALDDQIARLRDAQATLAARLDGVIVKLDKLLIDLGVKKAVEKIG